MVYFSGVKLNTFKKGHFWGGGQAILGFKISWFRGGHLDNFCVYGGFRTLLLVLGGYVIFAANLGGQYLVAKVCNFEAPSLKVGTACWVLCVMSSVRTLVDNPRYVALWDFWQHFLLRSGLDCKYRYKNHVAYFKVVSDNSSIQCETCSKMCTDVATYLRLKISHVATKQISHMATNQESYYSRIVVSKLSCHMKEVHKIETRLNTEKNVVSNCPLWMWPMQVYNQTLRNKDRMDISANLYKCDQCLYISRYSICKYMLFLFQQCQFNYLWISNIKHEYLKCNILFDKCPVLRSWLLKLLEVAILTGQEVGELLTVTLCKKQ